MVDPQKIIRTDGTKVTTPRQPSWKTEIYGLWIAVRDDPLILLLFPMFFASNWFFTWRKQTRILVSTLNWLSLQNSMPTTLLYLTFKPVHSTISFIGSPRSSDLFWSGSFWIKRLLGVVLVLLQAGLSSSSSCSPCTLGLTFIKGLFHFRLSQSRKSDSFPGAIRAPHSLPIHRRWVFTTRAMSLGSGSISFSVTWVRCGRLRHSGLWELCRMILANLLISLVSVRLFVLIYDSRARLSW